MRLSSLACGLAGAAAAVNALPTITTLGNKFFDSDGKQFFMRGTEFLLRYPSGPPFSSSS